jgi:hypothetical protein
MSKSKIRWTKPEDGIWETKDHRIERELSRGKPIYVVSAKADDSEIAVIIQGDDTAAAALKKAKKKAAEAAKLGVATALVWTYDDQLETWTAPGPDGRTYICEQEAAGWWAHFDDEELSRPVELEVAQAICQRHRDTELVWREAEPGTLWVATSAVLDGAEDYCAIRPNAEQPWWAKHLGDPIGEPTSKNVTWAQQACQEHHRELVGWPEPGEQDVKPEKPAERELVTRSILCDLTPDELAQIGLDLAKADEKAENLEADLTRLKETFAEQRKSLEGSIEGAKVEKRRLRGLRLTGQEYRELQVHEQLGPDPGDGTARELIFTHSETEEVLDSRPATKDELQKWLPQCGGPDDPPADKPPVSMDEACDQAGIPFADEQAPAKPSSTEPPRELPVRSLTREDFARQSSGDYLTKTQYAAADGEHYRIGKPEGSKLYRVTFAGTEQPERELPGEHRLLKDAVEQASGDNQHRLRWPGDPASGLLVSRCGKYQLSQCGDPNDAGEQWWRAEAIGGQDEDNTDLGEHDELTAAQAACQTHADAGRAGQ